MTTATRPRIATPIKKEVEITCKPKTIKIGHGYYDLKLVREIVNTLPDGEVRLISKPGKWPELEAHYNRGSFRLMAQELPYYAPGDKGKVEVVRSLKYHQGDDQPVKSFSLLAVELKRG